jgi:hypothetical protein
MKVEIVTDSKEDSEDYVIIIVMSDAAAAVCMHSSHDMMILDSGASWHMTPHQHLLQNFENIPNRPITAANQQVFSATGIGRYGAASFQW